MSAMFSVSFPMVYVYNPNTIFLKSVLAGVSRSLLMQLKCEHLTSSPDVDSFVERGVGLADLELVTGRNFPLEMTMSNLLCAGGARKCQNLLLG